MVAFIDQVLITNNMDNLKLEDLKARYKKLERTNVKVRMLAVSSVCLNNVNVQDTTSILLQSADWVSMWVKCFEDEDLCDFPKD